MAWGMPLPLGPYGEYEGTYDAYSNGWRHRLMAHYNAEMSAEEKAYFRDARRYSFCVGEKFTYERGRKEPGPDDIVVTPIQAHEPPRFFIFESGNKAPPAIVSLPDRILAVSEPFKGFVDWLEPGVHQFFPIEIRNKRGPVYKEQYYILVIGRYLESLSVEHSAKDLLKGVDSVPWWGIPHGKKEVIGLALSTAEIGNAHVWRERAFGAWLNCFSDRFMAEIRDAGLKMPGAWHMKDV